MHYVSSVAKSGVTAAFLALALVLGGAGNAHACACCESYIVVNVEEWDTLNVRTGPGTNFQVIAELKPGTCGVEKTGRKQGKWIQIISGDIAGWVHGRYIEWKP